MSIAPRSRREITELAHDLGVGIADIENHATAHAAALLGELKQKASDGLVANQLRLHEIGWAVKQMWDGQAVTRRGWNGRGMWLRIQMPDIHYKMSKPYVYIKTADGDLVPWLASQADLLATDWQLHEAT